MSHGKTSRFQGHNHAPLTALRLMVGSFVLGAAVGWRITAPFRWRSAQLRSGVRRRLTSLWTDVRGLRIRCRTSGPQFSGDCGAVVLVHGFGISSSYFVPTAELLAPNVRVFAPDLPGHGKSDTPKKAFDVPAQAGILVEWMDAVGLDKAVLIGNSLGCQIAVEIAVRFPNRVSGLVLTGPTMDPHARNVAWLFPRFVIAGLFERMSLSGLIIKDYLRMGLRLLPELRFMLLDRIEDKLPRVTAPTMLVRGARDTIVPQRWLEEIAGLVRARNVAVISRWGHAVNYSAAEQLVEAITPFLRQCADSPINSASTGR